MQTSLGIGLPVFESVLGVSIQVERSVHVVLTWEVQEAAVQLARLSGKRRQLRRGRRQAMRRDCAQNDAPQDPRGVIVVLQGPSAESAPRLAVHLQRLDKSSERCGSFSS